MKKRIVCLALAVLTALTFTACGQKKDHDKKEITVGSKGFTENLILSELYALALEDAGFEVEREFEISNAVIHQTLCEGEIDLYPEYTGTALMTILQQPMLTDPQKVYDSVKQSYEEQFDLTLLAMCEASDGNALVIRKETARKYGIRTISDLKKQCYRELSGGQQQRTLIARALCATDKLLVLDEPITGLDPSAIQDFYHMIKKLNREEQVAVLMVSHDIQNIVHQADKVLHLKRETLFYGPVSDYVKSRVGKGFLGGEE